MDLRLDFLSLTGDSYSATVIGSDPATDSTTTIPVYLIPVKIHVGGSGGTTFSPETLQSNGKSAVTITNPTLTPTVQADFAKVTDIAGLAELAITLETIAAQTYQAETAKLKSSAAIGLSSSIQPVEMQHIAILYYVLGMYPGAQTSAGIPLAFNPTSMAV